MKMFIKKLLFVFLTVLLVISIFGCGKEKIVLETNEEAIKVGWSDWVGWMPWEIVKEKDLLGENSANAELVYFDNYTDSMQALKEGKISALNVTINDALALKADIDDLQIVLVNDVSNGGDGILVKKDLNIDSVSDLKGRIVSLEKNSVSHYLFLRALEEAGVSVDDVQINDVPADLAGEAFLGKAFLDDKYTQVVVTWNPHLTYAEKEGKGKILFDSSQMYGEITDVLVVKSSLIESREDDFQGVVNAWCDAMGMVESPKSRDEAVSIMAKKAGVSSDDFEALMFDTEIFTKVKKIVDFMGIDGKGKLNDYVEKVHDFLIGQKIIQTPLDLDGFINSVFVVNYYNEN